jgi:hypothetical protein
MALVEDTAVGRDGLLTFSPGPRGASGGKVSFGGGAAGSAGLEGPRPGR